MPTLSESFRAPADSHIKAIRRALSALVASPFWPQLPCLHRHVTRPLRNRQHCLDCGATRLYIFRSDFDPVDAGIFKGPWRRRAITPLQRVFRGAHCTDCGRELIAGRCPTGSVDAHLLAARMAVLG